jgi:hypothetical protein
VIYRRHPTVTLSGDFPHVVVASTSSGPHPARPSQGRRDREATDMVSIEQVGRRSGDRWRRAMTDTACSVCGESADHLFGVEGVRQCIDCTVATNRRTDQRQYADSVRVCRALIGAPASEALPDEPAWRFALAVSWGEHLENRRTTERPR